MEKYWKYELKDFEDEIHVYLKPSIEGLKIEMETEERTPSIKVKYKDEELKYEDFVEPFRDFKLIQVDLVDGYVAIRIPCLLYTSPSPRDRG